MTDTLPPHGPIACRACWTDPASRVHTTSDRKFRIVNDPGAWGSTRPEILVLGISKGFTQADAYEKVNFDAVPFKGCRSRLRQSLAAIGVMDSNADIDAAMSRREQRYGWGSLVRCSLSGWNAKKQVYGAGTPEVLPAFEHPEAGRFVDGCMRRFLGRLPDTTRIVVLLGNADAYVESFAERLRRLHPQTYRRLNPVAHSTGVGDTGQALWVHAAHPSPGNGHFTAFINGAAESKQGAKRECAKGAVAQWSGGRRPADQAAAAPPDK